MSQTNAAALLAAYFDEKVHVHAMTSRKLSPSAPAASTSAPRADHLDLTRRDFLLTAGAVAIGFSGLHRLFATTESLTPRTSAIGYGYGPLLPDPAKIFDLPAGFKYTVIGRQGEPMADGLITPGDMDGMAAFRGPKGSTILVRNHELKITAKNIGPLGANNELLSKVDAAKFYDIGAVAGNPSLGGTSTVIFDTKTQIMQKQWMSLIGTQRNCAGGPTPWGTWITCEEDTNVNGATFAKNHGYCFEVPATTKPGLAAPRPIVGMGRFNHEAIAVDPKSGIVYLTEDAGDGLIYRYIPKTRGKLHHGGTLQALAVRDARSLDTRNWTDQTVAPGKTLLCEWITVDDVEAPKNDLRTRGFAAGAAKFARGEGMWYGNGGVYFACTNGGQAKKGQVWKYTPSKFEGTTRETKSPGELVLFVEPNDGGLIDNADNLTVAPHGDIILCEDGSGEQFLVGVSPKGHIYKIGRNAMGESELAGACFSPDGSTMFVNIQHNGLCLAITGPWKSRKIG